MGSVEVVGGDIADLGFKRVTLEATVIRADGTREELGTIADSNAYPVSKVRSSFLKRIGAMLWRIK